MSNLVENIDNLTLEELNERLELYKNEANRYYNQEQAIKRILNSIYGAFGNKWFYFFNVNIAESITKQGKNAILYTEKMINEYFYKFWHKDKTVHKELGITVTGEIKNPVGLYIDTDSCAANTLINTDIGKIKIEELYNISNTSIKINLDNGNQIEVNDVEHYLVVKRNNKEVDIKPSVLKNEDYLIKVVYR